MAKNKTWSQKAT